jgi:hypothetical protein
LHVDPEDPDKKEMLTCAKRWHPNIRDVPGFPPK